MQNFPIAVAHGDGIGPEIMEAVLDIFRAADLPLEFRPVEMGRAIYERGVSTGITREAKAIVEATGLLFKGPMETPRGGGVKSINVTARKIWNAFANVRVFRSLRGIETIFSKAGIPIDLTIIRENIEDTYGGVEHFLTEDVAMCRRFITRPGSRQVHRFAFEMARARKARRLTCGHKANIMKLTDGMFLETFYETARQYPDIVADDVIVDDLSMKLVTRPDKFHFIVLPNLPGDIISDLCAGLVGGLGFAPSANIGDYISIFEAVHGTAPDIAGKGVANPTSLLLTGIMMLRHLQLRDDATRIETALFRTLEDGYHTADFGNHEIASLSTSQFTQKIIERLEKRKGVADTQIPKKRPAPSEAQMAISPDLAKREVVGFDVFFESSERPVGLSEKLLAHCPAQFTLVTITNRGTQVWPVGSVYTECVNQYHARFESKDKTVVSTLEVLTALEQLAASFQICSVELLNRFGQKYGYSLAQGQ